MSISAVRSLTTDFRCFPVHREIFVSMSEKILHIRYHLGKGIKTSKRFVIPDIDAVKLQNSRGIVWQDRHVQLRGRRTFK